VLLSDQENSFQMEEAAVNMQQPQPVGSGTDGPEPAAALAEIQRSQERVINGVLVPVWSWGVIAAAMIAIGVARDSGDSVVEAVAIPLAVLVIAGLIGATIPEVHRRVQVHSDTRIRSRVGAAIFALIVAVDGAIVATAASLSAAHDRDPVTIGTAAGAAVILIAGPLLNWYARRLMLSQARQQLSDGSQARGSTP
jgi:hypothetical protein